MKVIDGHCFVAFFFVFFLFFLGSSSTFEWIFCFPAAFPVPFSFLVSCRRHLFPCSRLESFLFVVVVVVFLGRFLNHLGLFFLIAPRIV